MIILTLPFPPSVNTYYRRGAHATYMSKGGREYKAKVADYIADSNTPKLGSARLYLEIVLWPKDKRKFDIDNRIKALLDSLQDAGVFDDDEQIDQINIYRGSGTVSGGQARVMIELIEDTK
jgi:crossover junction endodeoxyribonuclease RusA